MWTSHTWGIREVLGQGERGVQCESKARCGDEHMHDAGEYQHVIAVAG